MGTGYTRADVSNNIDDDKVIEASDLDAEFDAIEDAFDASTGHTHDGTTAEGAPIEVTGPAQEYLYDGTAIYPKTDDAYDLGKTSAQFKDLYIDGVGYLDEIDELESLTLSNSQTILPGSGGGVDIDNVNIDGNTISSTDTNGDIIIDPNGSGTVVIGTDLDINNLNIDGNTISSTNTNGNIILSPDGTGRVIQTRTEIDDVRILNNSISTVGTNQNLNISPNGTGAVSIGGRLSVLNDFFTVENLRLSGNTILSIDTDGDINLDPDGNGSVVVGTDLQVDNLNLDGNTLGSSGILYLTPNSPHRVQVANSLRVDNINIDGNTISSTIGDINLTPDGVSEVVMGDATATRMAVDNIVINSNVIGSISGNDLKLTPASGQAVDIGDATFSGEVRMNNVTNKSQLLNDLGFTGMILMWSGAIVDIPTGWALCDGTGGTPDLRDKFVLGAGDTYAVDDTGGTDSITDVPEHTHTATAASNGSHTHGAGTLATDSAGDHDHDMDWTQFTNTTTGGAANRVTSLNNPGTGSDTRQTSTEGAHTHNITGSTASDGSHTHTITVDNTGSASVSVLNPYYALAFIMKVS